MVSSAFLANNLFRFKNVFIVLIKNASGSLLLLYFVKRSVINIDTIVALIFSMSFGNFVKWLFCKILLYMSFLVLNYMKIIKYVCLLTKNMSKRA